MMPTTVADSLLDKLIELQAKEGLSDYKFADKLGISHQLWQMTRTGKREIGLTILEGILRAYPKLNQDVLIFLGWDVDSSTLSPDINRTRTLRHHNRFLGTCKRLIHNISHALENTDSDIGR